MLRVRVGLGATFCSSCVPGGASGHAGAGFGSVVVLGSLGVEVRKLFDLSWSAS
jgi:hypothetical protein